MSKGETGGGKPAPRRKPSWRAKLILLAISCIVALAILEAYVRLTWVGKWGMPAEAMMPPGPYAFRLRPNLVDVLIPVADIGNQTFSTNADGFRGPLVKEIQDKPLKIVSLGDSITFAWGLEMKQHCMELFVDQYMRQHPEHPIGHAVIALPGWAPNDYYYAYSTMIQQYKPDIIVLGFFAGNDVMSLQAPCVLDPALAPEREMFRKEEHWFQSFQWIKAHFSSSLMVARVAIKMGHVPSSFSRFDQDLERQRQQWDVTFFFLKALKEQTDAHNTRLVILSWPSLVQVNIASAIDGAGLDHAAPDKILGEFCQSNGIDLIELLKPMQQANTSNDLFWAIDRHPTAKGHEVVAGQLNKALAPIVDQVRERKFAARPPTTSPPTSP